jgi:hypothetical protein
MAGGERPDADRSTRVVDPVSALPGIIEDFVDGYLVPVDPMDDLQCESCQ